MALSALAACTPDGYSESPVMRDYFEKKLGDAMKGDVSGVSLCGAATSDKGWVASIMFKDGALLSYKVLGNNEEPLMELFSQSTQAQRTDREERGHTLDLDCFGYRSAGGFLTTLGAYRFELEDSRVKAAYVKTYNAVNYPFDAQVTKLLDQAAAAVSQAVAAHRKIVPPEQTWGVKP